MITDSGFVVSAKQSEGELTWCSLSLSLCFYVLQCAQVYPVKYCRLVEEEQGIELLTELLNHEKPNGKIKSLARMVIINCESTNQNNSSMELDG